MHPSVESALQKGILAASVKMKDLSCVCLGALVMVTSKTGWWFWRLRMAAARAGLLYLRSKEHKVFLRNGRQQKKLLGLFNI